MSNQKHTETRGEDQIVMIPLHRVKARPTQMRKTFDGKKIQNLADSMKTLREMGGGIDGTGILQALTGHYDPSAVRRDGSVKPDAKVIIDIGESRYRAAKAAGFDNSDPLPFVIKDANAQLKQLEQIIENIQRYDVDAMDVAQTLTFYAKENGVTMQALADQIGKPLHWVQQYFDLMRAPENVLRLLDEDPNTVQVIQRISRVKNEELQNLMVELKLAGSGYFSFKSIAEWEHIEDEELRKQLMDRVRAEMEQAKEQGHPINWNELHPVLRRIRYEAGNVQIMPDNNSNWSPVPNASQEWGTKGSSEKSPTLPQSKTKAPAQTVHTLPKFDVELELASFLRRLKNVADTAAPATKIPNKEKVLSHLTEIEGLALGIRRNIENK
jgi:ParB/RepB/Spo0J family partition protein